MHIVDPARMKPPIESVAAFQCDPVELGARLKASEVDQLSTPGPAKLGVIELPNGAIIGVVIHDHASFAEILAPMTTSLEENLVEAFRQLDVSPSQIDWMREGVDQGVVISALAAARGDVRAPRRFHIDFDAHFESVAKETLLTEPEVRALTLLLVRASVEPRLAASIGETGIHMLRLDRMVLADGAEISPLAIFYRINAQESAITVVDIQRLGSSDISISPASFVEAITDVSRQDQSSRSPEADHLPSFFHFRPRTVDAALQDVREFLRRAS